MRPSSILAALAIAASLGPSSATARTHYRQHDADRRSDRDRENAAADARHQAAITEGRRKMAAAQAKRDRKAAQRRAAQKGE